MTDLNNTDHTYTGHVKGHSDDIFSSFLTEDEIKSWKQDLSSDACKEEMKPAAAAFADGFGDISDFFKSKDHTDSYAGFQETQSPKESHSAFDVGENTGGTAMDSYWGREAGLTADRDLISEFVQESIAQDQAITRVQDARVAEDDIYATDDRVTEDHIIALDDRVAEDDVYATDDRVTEEDVFATDDRVSVYDVYATYDKVAKDEVAATDDRISEDDVYATDESVAEDDVIASDDRVSEDDVYVSDEKVTEDEIYDTDQEIREEEIAPDQDISYTYTTPDPRKGKTGQLQNTASKKNRANSNLLLYVMAFIIALMYFILSVGG